jgi:hypothetical protein
MCSGIEQPFNAAKHTSAATFETISMKRAARMSRDR